jgi:hypothetical protein
VKGDRIRVFRLLDVGTLENEAATIAQALFGLPPDAVGTLFTVSQSGGWISFTDRAQLFSNRAKRLPKEREAREAALRFLAERREAMAASPCYRESELPLLIPPAGVLTDPVIVPVQHPRLALRDHWLCRFGIEVRCSDDLQEEKAEVLGAGVDLRIGEGGAVIAAVWRWRPEVEIRSRPRRPAPEGARRVVYRYNDEAGRQTFLAPYYEVIDEHDVLLAPASDCSLICNVLTGNGKLLAAVDGGTGDYSFTWARIAPASFPPAIEPLASTDRILELGGGRRAMVSEADFGSAAADVLLQVRDNRSDAVIQLRRAIYPTLAAAKVLS